MIVHFFPGDFTHLTIPLIDSIINNSEKDHFFLLSVFKEENKGKYNQLFEKHPSTKFLIFDSSDHSKLSKILMYLIGHSGVTRLEEAAIATVLYKFRKYAIVSHFYFKSYALLPLFKSYAWVCWGNIPRASKKSSKIGVLKFKYYTKKILRKCNRIVTLMDPDKEKLVNSFKCKRKRISVITYIFRENEFIPMDIDNSNSDGKQKILLGNNLFLIKSYISALSFLTAFANHSMLYAMMSYGDASDLDKKIFISKAEGIFKDNFTPIYEFIPLENYNAWLNEFNIYVSIIQVQSGLGVIYRMVGLGKKLFLAGHNYEWCIKNGLIVFHVNELSNGEMSNLLPLSREEKESNKKMLNKMLDVDVLSQKWDEFYSSLLT